MKKLGKLQIYHSAALPPEHYLSTEPELIPIIPRPQRVAPLINAETEGVGKGERSRKGYFYDHLLRAILNIHAATLGIGDELVCLYVSGCSCACACFPTSRKSPCARACGLICNTLPGEFADYNT